MDRRDFIKCVIAAGIGMTVPRGFSDIAASDLDTGIPDLVVAHGPSQKDITHSAIQGLGGMGRFVSRGDIVVIKPNIGWDRKPEQAATTNPEVVAALVELCYDAGAKQVKIFDRSVDDPRRCYRQSGIEEAARAVGAEVTFIDERKFKDVTIDGLALKEWSFYRDILEADKIINVPIAKHHGSARLSMAMKNWMGVIGGWRGRIHLSMDKCLVDFALVIKPTLTLLDAVRILTDHGPQGGNLQDVRKLDTIVAGVNQVAVDAFGTTLFGLKPEDFGYLRLARQHGMGVIDLKQLSIQHIQGKGSV
ncbi:MAG TPA: DUF362 domain-containing protein [Thermodesulfobacteriota bacterium]|nr:DUF362 domain-containing protein [Deltaproteobacteria bacterium]HNR11845.1 DUF362 domain-containing protein [Thermodesulfobacteriota bacterium]HNU70100.1 DUF362 domain-containing protein [Thermodesulfobacteriota bacterium]HOC38379.1 DUF362 domain-containing protein [Thermodesulfobacteriota bacterium]